MMIETKMEKKYVLKNVVSRAAYLSPKLKKRLLSLELSKYGELMLISTLKQLDKEFKSRIAERADQEFFAKAEIVCCKLNGNAYKKLEKAESGDKEGRLLSLLKKLN